MESIQNVLEYYDELFPVTEDQKKFYSELMTQYEKPVRFLRIGCGTGYFENLLARDGHDVTGIDTSKKLLECANLRRRTQLMAIRFFLMSSVDMTKFLGKNFYNIISCLDNRIVFIRDRDLMQKFFCDCRELLVENGTLILNLSNFKIYDTNTKFSFPTIESIRTKLYMESFPVNGKTFLRQKIENSSGKILPVIENEEYYPLTSDEIEQYAKTAGFKSVRFYSSFKKEEYTGSEKNIIAVIS